MKTRVKSPPKTYVRPSAGTGPSTSGSCGVEGFGLGALAAGFWGFVGGASLLLGALAGVYVGASR
jgi:hypothetical protein